MSDRPIPRIVRLPEPIRRDLPRAVLGMLDLLPNVGEPFPLRQRLIWLRALAGIFDLAYGCDGAAELKIEVKDAEL